MRLSPSFAALLTGLPIVAAQLNVVANACGKKYFGSATDNPELSDRKYVSILSNIEDFGQITPSNSMKWDATEPYQGVFNFTGGDVIANLAKRNGQLLRGHNLVWHSQLPLWVSNSNFTAAQLTSVIIDHATEVVTHYRGQAYAWDVVNEPFNDNGTYRTDVFYNTLGTNYINIAFEAAHVADPAAKLYLNEYNLEYAGPKFEAALSLVKQLLADGVPVQGVGFQGHQIVGQVPTTFQTNMQAFADLGVDVAITELDIRMTLPVTEAQLIQQAKDYQYIVSACRDTSRCVGVTVWDYTDKYSWIPGVFSGQGAACPWDENLVKKPAYYGALAGLLL